jgi:cytochrome P450
MASEDITLSDGTFVPKNAFLSVSSHNMWDSSVHADPERWDGYRFYRMRQEPGRENFALSVTTSPEHLAFGHGTHGCPGRFFAINEIKIALAIILMKYDVRLPEGETPTPMAYGTALNTDPKLRVDIRRRAEEIEL